MQSKKDLYSELLGLSTRPAGKVLERPIRITPIPETIRSGSTITNSLLRTINLFLTGTERLPGKQTNKKYARAIIKTLEKEVLEKRKYG